MKFPWDIGRVLRTTRVLDDRVDRTSRARAEMDEQGMVDAELADAKRLPWRKPSGEVRTRVLVEIESRRYHRRRQRSMPAWPLRLALAAAIGILVWGLPIWKTSGTMKPDTIGAAKPAVPVAFVRGIEDDLREEAAAIGEDTRRAAELFLGRLPLGDD